MTGKILMTTQNMQKENKFKEKRTCYACLQHGWLGAVHILRQPGERGAQWAKLGGHPV